MRRRRSEEEEEAYASWAPSCGLPASSSWTLTPIFNTRSPVDVWLARSSKALEALEALEASVRALVLARLVAGPSSATATETGGT